MGDYTFYGDLKKIDDIERLFHMLPNVISRDSREIHLDLSKLEFISPLGAISLLLLDKLQNTDLQITPPKRHVISYIERMNFFENCSERVRSCFEEHCDLFYFQKRRRNNTGQVLLEITPIKNEKDIGSIFESILNILTSHGMRSKSANQIAFIASELGTNIIDHSEGDGYAAIQYYPSHNKVEIGIGDNGIGIVNALKSSLLAQRGIKHISDLEVVKSAFEERISSKTNITKRGMGLSISREKSFHNTQQTNFYVRTHKAIYQIFDDNICCVDEGDYFPGTYISLEILF